jgi:hypothetical protein
MTTKKQKNWVVDEEEELIRCYLTLDMETKALAKRYECTVAEIKRKLKEFKVWAGY